MTRPDDPLTARLRAEITAGDRAPGTTLPSVADAQKVFGVREVEVRAAYKTLQQEGLVRGIPRRGTVVLGPAVHRVARRRAVFRDQLGYYFDPAGQSLRLVGKPSVATGLASLDIAHRLAVPVGSPVVVRERVLGEQGTKRTRARGLQIATSYLPGWLWEQLPIVGEAVTGPGGIYDRIEEWAQAPLSWEEAQGAVVAPREDALRLAGVTAGAALVRIVRTATLPDGRPVEVNDTRMDGARFETTLVIERHESAGWPPDPAVESPQVIDTDDDEAT